MLDWNVFNIDVRFKKIFCIEDLSLVSTCGLHLVCFAVVMVISNMEVVKKWPEVVFAAVPVFATVNQGAECVSVILDGGL